MDASKGSGPGGDRRKELLAELDGIRSAQGNVKNNRQKVIDQVKTLQDGATARVCLCCFAALSAAELIIGDDDMSIRLRTCNHRKRRTSTNLLRRSTNTSSTSVFDCAPTTCTDNVPGLGNHQGAGEANRSWQPYFGRREAGFERHQFC